MHKLIFYFLLLLLGINGMFVWQNQKKSKKTVANVCRMPGKANLPVSNIETFVLPGALLWLNNQSS